MGLLDQLLQCGCEGPAGLSDGVFRVSGLVFQIGCHARTAKTGAEHVAAPKREKQEEFVLHFPDSTAGGSRWVVVTTTAGETVGRHHPDPDGVVRIPAKAGDEFDFIAMFDGMPVERIRLKA
jgi:hypothetical protein